MEDGSLKTSFSSQEPSFSSCYDSGRKGSMTFLRPIAPSSKGAGVSWNDDVINKCPSCPPCFFSEKLLPNGSRIQRLGHYFKCKILFRKFLSQPPKLHLYKIRLIASQVLIARFLKHQLLNTKNWTTWKAKCPIFKPKVAGFRGKVA